MIGRTQKSNKYRAKRTEKAIILRFSILAGIFRGVEKLRRENGSTKRANRVLGEPSIGALEMEAMIATGN